MLCFVVDRLTFKVMTPLLFLLGLIQLLLLLLKYSGSNQVQHLVLTINYFPRKTNQSRMLGTLEKKNYFLNFVCDDVNIVEKDTYPCESLIGIGRVKN